MLNWANQFNIFCLLDNNAYNHQASEFEICLGAGAQHSIALEPGTAFGQLRFFYDLHKGWIFGHLGYGLKNEIENLPNHAAASIDFGIGFFFVPKYVISIKENTVYISSWEQDHAEIFRQISNTETTFAEVERIAPTINPLLSREDYLQKITKLKKHIARGDCYEINFCQQFIAENISPDPVHLYRKLNRLSPNPFAALYKLKDKICICASPERFLKKQGKQLISQPIKGTAARNLQDAEKDEQLRRSLLESEKERSENVMVVDLVRNDLSKVATRGSVQVTELFGLYRYPQVHQMISTIRAEIAAHVHPVDALQACFPMGSMTGAPKKRVMELIDETEDTPRGLFSGSIGYFSPDSGFDFNVVIRSIFLDQNNKQLNFWAGGGITSKSVPELEYEESMLKAQAIVAVLGGQMKP